MPYPDGTPYAEEQAADARAWLTSAAEADYDAALVGIKNALIGIGYALLANYELSDSIRRNPI